jgi:hypothetical protein
MIEVWYLTLCLVGDCFALVEVRRSCDATWNGRDAGRVGSIRKVPGFLHVRVHGDYQIRHSVLIVVSYQFRPVLQLGAWRCLAIPYWGCGRIGLIFGATASALSGYVSMWVASQSNIRSFCRPVRMEKRSSFAFRGGAFSVLNLTLCITG